MREMMWIFAVIIFSVCETWSLDTGSPQSTLMRNTSSSAPKVYVVRNASFNLGNDVNLTCSNEPRSKVFYVLWKIDLKYKECSIAHNNDGQSTDSCNDGKSLQNTPTAVYLHIPNFSNDDVGVYLCETVYIGGADAHMINVEITAPPSISAWLEWKGNKMVAVCKAERGKPAASISWSHLENSSSLKTWSGSDGFFTVESHLELPENMDPKTLSCTVRYLYWEEEKTLVPKLTAAPPSISAWLEWKDNKMVAVCKAERGKPAASISWSHLENSSSLKTWSGSDGFFTVESHLELPENMDPKNLSCTVRYLYWEEEKTLVPKLTAATRPHFTMMSIRIIVIIVAVLAVILFFAKKKLRCCGVAGR